MTGHRATVRVDGVEWELHADGSRTATVGGVQFEARQSRLVSAVWYLYTPGRDGVMGLVAATALSGLSGAARAEAMR